MDILKGSVINTVIVVATRSPVIDSDCPDNVDGMYDDLNDPIYYLLLFYFYFIVFLIFSPFRLCPC